LLAGLCPVGEAEVRSQSLYGWAFPENVPWVRN